MAYITVRAEWDMGHRLPNHNGLCRNLHGHHYVADVTLQGKIKDTEGSSDEGMVVDFSDLKGRLREIVKRMDHMLMLCNRDPLLIRLRDMPGISMVDFVPTAENIAQYILNELPDVWRVKLFETPTSYAEVLR